MRRTVSGYLARARGKAPKLFESSEREALTAPRDQGDDMLPLR
jgi:hypothetical protein